MPCFSWNEGARSESMEQIPVGGYGPTLTRTILGNNIHNDPCRRPIHETSPIKVKPSIVLWSSSLLIAFSVLRQATQQEGYRL